MKRVSPSHLDQAVVVHAEGARRAGTLALGLHLALEALFIQSQITLARDVTGQIDREAVSVVQRTPPRRG